jgi:hypothetical protein
VVWVSAETPGGVNIAIGLDPAGVGNGSTTGVTSKGTGLAITDLAPGTGRAIWLRRTATNSAAIDNDSATLSFEGDTNA